VTHGVCDTSSVECGEWSLRVNRVTRVTRDVSQDTRVTLH